MGRSSSLPSRAFRSFWALLLLSWPALASGDGLYLHVVPIRAPADREVREAIPLRLAAYAARPAAVAAALGPGPVRSVERERLEIDLVAYPQLEPSHPDSFRAASFVLDFDEPPVAALRARLLAEHGDAPSSEALRRFTDAAIPHKSMARGWDLASQVARSGVGDCSEHAVLLAALARGVGRPARVVVGLVIVATDAGPRAFGHAWAELHDGGRWQVADATLLPGSSDPIYLPLALLGDEGPGYVLALAGALRETWVRELEILETAP